MYGNLIPGMIPDISVIGELDKSLTGNIVLPVGKLNVGSPGWHKTEHVVLTPDEARKLCIDILMKLDE